MRDHAHTLSDFRTETLSIECEFCGRFGRYNVAKLIEQYGDMKLPELRHVLANCPKAKSFSIHDRCKVSMARTAGSHDLRARLSPLPDKIPPRRESFCSLLTPPQAAPAPPSADPASAACGNLSSLMTPLMAAVTAASSSSGMSIIGTGRI